MNKGMTQGQKKEDRKVGGKEEMSRERLERKA